jgi:hypothetical protein
MKKYKTFKVGELFGIKDLSNQVILDSEFEFIELYFDQYFYVQKAGRKFVLNSNRDLIYDLKNEPYKNQFQNDLGAFNLLCIEEKDNQFLSFYGENTAPDSNESNQVYQVVIYAGTVSKRLLSKGQYLAEMAKDTGINVDQKALKDLLN